MTYENVTFHNVSIAGLRIGFDQVVYTVSEFDRYLTLNIVAFNNVTRPYPATFLLTNGTAIPFEDFEYPPVSTMIEFNIDATAFSINVSISRDFLLEGTEEFFGHLSSEHFAVEFENNLTTIRILDGDCKSICSRLVMPCYHFSQHSSIHQSIGCSCFRTSWE